ncbi:MAG: Smr domain [Fibrobacterota bacterium]
MKTGGPREWKAQARLDLHLLTAADAEEKLQQFLQASFFARKERVLVIHGAKLLAGVVKRVLAGHALVEHQMPDNPGATRVWLGAPPVKRRF